MSATHPLRVAAAKKQAQALELRAAGIDFETIARTVGYKDRSGAFAAVDAALDKLLEEPAKKVRRLERARLDRLWRGAFAAAQRGDLDAIDKCLRIMARRAKLDGLDRVKKVRLSGSVKVKGPAIKIYKGFNPEDVVLGNGEVIQRGSDNGPIMPKKPDS